MKKIKLSNGVEMPQLGYGVYQVEPDECERCVLDALSVGYRMIDTAQAYLNEEAVSNAWKKSGVNRDEIFLVSKVWPSNYGDGQTMKSIDESLRKLQTDYIDLMLLHQPYCDRYGAYRDLEKAYKEGKVRAIGVSNFFPDHLIDLASNMEIAPMVNQMETHVFNQQHETRKFMDEFGTKLMAFRFSGIRSLWTVFGMMITSFCSSQRKATCAAVLPYFSPIWVRVGLVNIPF